MKGFRYLLASLLMALVVLVVGGVLLEGVRAEVSAGPLNLIANGSFESGDYAPENLPDGWQQSSFLPGVEYVWRDNVAHHGQKSVQITAESANDARWTQTVTVKPNTTYLLSGWIKSEDVGHTAGTNDAGANLCIEGTFERTEGIFGTADWTYVSMLVDSGANSALTICARLGFFSGTTTGTAWFDNLKLVELDPQGPKPAWKVLALIYTKTDFTYTDSGNKEHWVVTTMSETDVLSATQAVQQFVNVDIPALTGGNMAPELTIRLPERKITQLSSFGPDAWWLGPADAGTDLDPEFDAVLVIWNPKGREINTDTPEDLSMGKYDGLAPNMGTNQTYTLITAGAVTTNNHRNVFKHEFGSSLLSFFDAAGTAPKPTVNNQAQSTDYVNCKSGQFYVWEEETLDNPIPNSIYNNESGFTHDYYSGMTATADQPQRCLGITPLAWATGGPVSGPIFYAYEIEADTVTREADPGTAVSYTLSIENRGNMTDTYQLSYSGNDWPVEGVNEIGPLGADQTLQVSVAVTIPLQVDGLETDFVTVEVFSDSDPRLAESMTMTTTAKAIYNFNSGVDATERSGDPGTAVSYTLKIDNMSNISDTYDVDYSGNVWTIVGPGTVGPLARDESTEFDLSVTVPADAPGLDMDSLSVTLTSQGDNALQSTVTMTTTANAIYAFDAGTDLAEKSGDVGTAVIYTFKIDNKSNISDTYDVQYAGNEWTIVGPGMVGPLASDESTEFGVSVNIPADALALDTDSLDVTFTSQGNSALKTTVMLTTTVDTAYGVQLLPEQSSAIGLPQETVSYLLTLKNTGNMSETFTLSSVDKTWLVAYPAEVGPLAPQESAQVEVQVTISADAADGEKETITVTATSQTMSGISASVNMTTTAKWPVLYLPLVVGE